MIDPVLIKSLDDIKQILPNKTFFIGDSGDKPVLALCTSNTSNEIQALRMADNKTILAYNIKHDELLGTYTNGGILVRLRPGKNYVCALEGEPEYINNKPILLEADLWVE